MKQFRKIIIAGALMAVCVVGVAKNYTAKQRVHLRNQSLNKYSVCDVNALAKQMVAGTKTVTNAKQYFDVRFVQDRMANYNYYLATTKTFNADAVRRAVCQYINKHQCFLYWGNVANVAMIADRPAPRFPLDTTPHYMLSPTITCNTKQWRGSKS